MKFLFSKKIAVLALSIASLSLTGNVQAHQDENYLPLVPFIIYNVLARPYHQHHQITPQRHRYYDSHRRHNHSRDGYSRKRLIKRNHRH